MASVFAKTLRARGPMVAGATILTVASVSYSMKRNPILLDAKTTWAGESQQLKEATKTLSFPRTMLFSKQLTVSKVEQVNHDTKRITFRLPGGEDEVSGVPGGGAILTQHTPTGGCFPVFRPYTPIVSERGLIQLLVKHYPNGKASSHLHSLQPGQDLTVRGPLPGYTWTPSTTARDVLFVAGGAGITPIYSLTASILSNPADKARIQLVWGVNGTRDIVLKQELESLEKQYPDRLRVTYCVSGKEDLASFGDKYKKGYVDQSVLKEATQRFQSGSWGDEKGTKVFLCGPPAMENAIVGKGGVMEALGVEKKSVHRF